MKLVAQWKTVTVISFTRFHELFANETCVFHMRVWRKRLFIIIAKIICSHNVMVKVYRFVEMPNIRCTRCWYRINNQLACITKLLHHVQYSIDLTSRLVNPRKMNCCFFVCDSSAIIVYLLWSDLIAIWLHIEFSGTTFFLCWRFLIHLSSSFSFVRYNVV